MQEVPPGPPDQLARLERYRHQHPDVAIQPPGAQSAVWRAFRDGELIAYGFTLMVFMERLEALAEPLAAVQDFGLQHLARRPSVREAPVKCNWFICLTAGTRTAGRDLGANARVRAGDTQVRRPAGEQGIQWPGPGQRASETSAVLALLRRTE